MAAKKLPRLKTVAEFARHVESHNMTPYLRDMERVDEALALDPELVERIRERARKRLIALRLPQWQVDGARRIAKKKGVPYQALMRSWIAEGLRHAWSRGGHAHR